MLVLLLIAAQTPERVPIDPPTEAAPTRTWSIQTDPYADAPYTAEACPTDGKDVVVCARPNTELRLPLPAERGSPEGPRTSVAYLDGAERPQGSPCAAIQQGCTTGINLLGGGLFLYRMGKKVIDPDAE